VQLYCGPEYVEYYNTLLTGETDTSKYQYSLTILSVDDGSKQMICLPEVVLIPETEPEVIPEPTPDPEPETEPEVIPEPTPDPEPETEPEVIPEPTTDPEPEKEEMDVLGDEPYFPSAPKTGDSGILLPVIVLLGSIVAIVVIKKKNNE
jgi:LPXTG-motif cell wall-anchored protein